MAPHKSTPAKITPAGTNAAGGIAVRWRRLGYDARGFVRSLFLSSGVLRSRQQST